MSQRRLSLWIKVIYTLYVAVLVPVYWQYRGPANFLWMSDIALLVGVPALWWENRLLASMMALAVALPELGWNLDFFSRLLTGYDLLGVNATAYMFDAGIPLTVRSLSLFHIFLPVVSFYLVFRLGYDRRALVCQTLVVWAALLVSYGFTDPVRNINWVYGLGEGALPWLSGPVYLLLLMGLWPVILLLPVHLALVQWRALGR